MKSWFYIKQFYRTSVKVYSYCFIIHQLRDAWFELPMVMEMNLGQSCWLMKIKDDQIHNKLIIISYFE